MREIVSFNKEIPLKKKIYKITSISLEHTLKQNQNQVTGDLIVSGSYQITGASPLEEEFQYKLPAEIVIDEKYNTDELEFDIDNFTYEVNNEEVLKVWIDIELNQLKEKEPLEKKETSEEEAKLDEVLKEMEQESVKDELHELEQRHPSDEIELLDFDEKEESEDLLKQFDTTKDFEIPSSNVVEKEDVMPKKEEKVIEKEQSIVESKESPLVEVEDIKEESKEEVPSIFMAFDNSQETYSTYRVYIVRENDSLDSILAKYKLTREQLEEYNDLQEIKLGTKLIIPSIKENE